MTWKFPLYGGSGWTCSACGRWVPSGSPHICTYQQPNPLAANTAALHALATAIRELVAALKEQDQ